MVLILHRNVLIGNYKFCHKVYSTVLLVIKRFSVIIQASRLMG